MSSFSLWKRIMGYLKPYRLWAIITFIGIVVNTSLAVAIPAILRDVVDIGIEREDKDYMLAAGFLVVGLGVLRGISGFTYRFFGERLSHYAAYDLRNEVYDKVQNLAFSYHDQAQTGTLVTRSISDVDEVQRYFAFGLIDGLNTGLLLVSVTTVMVLTSPVLAVISLLPLLPLAFLSRRFAMRVHPIWKQIMERLQQLGNHIQENSLGAEVVRAFNREEYEVKKFAKSNEELYEDRVSLIQDWATYLPMTMFIIAFSTALVLFSGGWMQQNGYGGVTVGLVVSFNAYVLLLAQPLRFLGFVIMLTTQAISSAERVFEILDEPTTVKNKPDAITPGRIEGHVRMENVQFGYEGIEKPVLYNINLEAKPGEVIALLGPTGSGKSTLVNLIPRFYDVTEGSIKIDGVDVRNLDINTLRKNIGIVQQSSLLFSASIRENIAYGRPDATEEEIIAAAKAADAHEFIVGFPEGYDTEVGERGVTLSGGQKQRVAIARALLVNPAILILDDSTSSVDTHTEYRIRDALSRLMKGRTTFVIAQRLNSLQTADQILVLVNGEVVERGTHEELLQVDRHYAETYRLQLEDQERVRKELQVLGKLTKPYGDKFDERLATEEFKALIDRVNRK